MSAPQTEAEVRAQLAAAIAGTSTKHNDECSMWHHQGGDYDRDCEACIHACMHARMHLAAVDQGLAGTVIDATLGTELEER